MANVYRVLLIVSILAAVSSAPQDSTITYVQPLTEDRPSQPRQLRESRIENLPLTIGAINVENPVEHANGTDPFVKQSDKQINVKDNEYTVQTSNEQSDIQRNVRESEYTTTETAEATEVTERSEEITTELNEVKPKFPTPRYISKLSYFKKSEDFEESALKNFLERTGKRKFRSRCRCEKIWNCPKLQITVPRCPDEYFLCCF